MPGKVEPLLSPSRMVRSISFGDLVDDNVDTAQTLALLLKTSGHDVRTAYTGPAALQAALDYRPNVMLLDIGLPGLNGNRYDSNPFCATSCWSP
jgi:FixJ family two-component response regulator